MRGKTTKPNIIQRGIKTGNIYLLLMALTFIIPMFFSKSEDSTANSTEVNQKRGAIEETEIKAYVVVAAQTKVEDYLKSPSTADFPWSIEPLKINDSTYTVVSYVDAQNGFGAMIRANFMVEVTIDRQTKYTKAKLILFEERK